MWEHQILQSRSIFSPKPLCVNVFKFSRRNGGWCYRATCFVHNANTVKVGWIQQCESSARIQQASSHPESTEISVSTLLAIKHRLSSHPLLSLFTVPLHYQADTTGYRIGCVHMWTAPSGHFRNDIWNEIYILELSHFLRLCPWRGHPTSVLPPPHRNTC
jgi:hypothetical protein